MVFPDIPDIPRPLPAPGYHETPKVTARTLEGLEWILKTELENLGAVDFRVGRRTVEFSAPRGHEREVLYRSVLESRTAIRILEPLGRFRVDSPEALYDAVKNIDWADVRKRLHKGLNNCGLVIAIVGEKVHDFGSFLAQV